jgi:hypothetical protein
MSCSKTKGKTLNFNEEHWSDSSELILAEVQANIYQEHSQRLRVFN